MSRRKRNVSVFTAIFLLAAMLLLYSSPRRTRAQEQEPPAPPLKRMRRAKGQQPKVPPQTTQTQSTSADDVVRVETDLANILLTAIDKDRRFVTTIRKEDVRVLEDNKPQEVSD